MKRLVLFFPLLLVAVMSYGQELALPQPAKSSIVRNGDRYTVDGMTYVNSTDFRNYLKNTNSEIFTQYNKGYKLGMTGWGLFSFGIVESALSILLLRTQLAILAIPFGSIGGAAIIAGVSLLGVGYYKMHQSVDVYNISRQPQPQAFWSIKASGNGIGVAYNF